MEFFRISNKPNVKVYYSNPVFKKKFNLKRFFVSKIFSCLLLIGCASQIYYICQLFFNFPITVSTETEFENSDKEFFEEIPAITLCKFSDALRIKRNLEEAFNNEDFRHSLLSTYIDKDFVVDQVLTENILNSSFRLINTEFNCFTVNSALKGN
jgi:hypothetical protein